MISLTYVPISFQWCIGFDDVPQDREDLSRATGAADAHEDFLSNLSRISQLTGRRYAHILNLS